ncbi:sigma-54-dependent transcriptional regulator [Lacipirellula parvula]|nr:sigma-54 dependent transcriptional regulator [Lacipirellula parvula]
MSLCSTGNRVMVIDDDPQVLRLLGAIIENEGANVELETDPRLALEHLRGRPFDALFTDLQMSGCSGLEVIREARRIQPGISTVIVTAYGTVDSTVNAFHLGAVDYITKPFRADQVAGALGRAATNNVKSRNRAMETKAAIAAAPATEASVVACSPAMQRVLEFAKRSAASFSPMLVTGETGAGKETVIRYIHSISSNSTGPLVKVNCEAVSEGQLAEVLFGKESATGEIQRGAMERAAGGMLFLHRVANIPKWMQAELATAFLEQRFLRVGGVAPVALEARIVASTSENIEPLVRAGGFVDDLHNFLSQAPLEVPPLRRRREDIRPLLASLMKEANRTSQSYDRRRKIEFTEEAMAKLERYEWPGNVYELENFVRRAIVFTSESQLSAARVAELLPPTRPPANTEMISVPYIGDLKIMERALVSEVINRSHGNKSAAARTLGLHRKSLYRIMEQDDENAEK